MTAEEFKIKHGIDDEKYNYLKAVIKCYGGRIVDIYDCKGMPKFKVQSEVRPNWSKPKVLQSRMRDSSLQGETQNWSRLRESSTKNRNGKGDIQEVKKTGMPNVRQDVHVGRGVQQEMLIM